MTTNDFYLEMSSVVSLSYETFFLFAFLILQQLQVENLQLETA